MLQIHDYFMGAQPSKLGIELDPRMFSTHAPDGLDLKTVVCGVVLFLVVQYLFQFISPRPLLESCL